MAKERLIIRLEGKIDNFATQIAKCINNNDEKELDTVINQLESKESPIYGNSTTCLQLIKKIFDITIFNGAENNIIDVILLFKINLKLINQAFTFGKGKIHYKDENIVAISYIVTFIEYILGHKSEEPNKVHRTALIQLLQEELFAQQALKSIFDITISNTIENYSENTENALTVIFIMVQFDALSDYLIEQFNDYYINLVNKITKQQNIDVISAQKQLLGTPFGLCFRKFYKDYSIICKYSANKGKKLIALLQSKLLFISDLESYYSFSGQIEERQNLVCEISEPLDRICSLITDHNLCDEGMQMMLYHYQAYKDLMFSNLLLLNISMLCNHKAMDLTNNGEANNGLHYFILAIAYLGKIRGELPQSEQYMLALTLAITESGFHEKIVDKAKKLLDTLIALNSPYNKHYMIFLHIICMEGLDVKAQQKKLNEINIEDIIELDNKAVKLLYLTYCNRLKQRSNIIYVFENQLTNHYFNAEDTINFIGIGGLLKSKQDNNDRLLKLIASSDEDSNYNSSIYFNSNNMRFYTIFNLYFLSDKSLQQKYPELFKKLSNLLNNLNANINGSLIDCLESKYESSRSANQLDYEENFKAIKSSELSEHCKGLGTHGNTRILLSNIIFLDIVILFERWFIKPQNLNCKEIIEGKAQILKDLDETYKKLALYTSSGAYFVPLRILIEELNDESLSDKDFVVRLFYGLAYYMHNPRYYYVFIKINPPLKGFIERIKEIEKSRILASYLPPTVSETEIPEVIKIADTKDPALPFGSKYDKLINIQGTKIYCYFEWDKIKAGELEGKFQTAAAVGKIVRPDGQIGFGILTYGKKHTIYLKILGQGGDYRVLATSKIKTDNGYLLFIFKSSPQKIHDGKQFTIRD